MSQPYTPFSTGLSGTAKETELRIRHIFQHSTKRPPLPLLSLALAAVLGCGSLVSCSVGDKVSPNAANPSDAEAQLLSFVASKDVWRVQDETDWWGYAITDLDQDGRWELIASEMHGTGHFQTTNFYWDDHQATGVINQAGGSSLDRENTLSTLASGMPLSGFPSLSPNFQCTGQTQSYQGYYDSAYGNYYYTSADTTTYKEEIVSTFTTLSVWSLQCGERFAADPDNQGKPGGMLLGCRWAPMGESRSDCWDAYGNYISESAFNTLVQEYCGDLEPVTVQIYWVEDQHLDELDDEELLSLLQESMDKFSLSHNQTL